MTTRYQLLVEGWKDCTRCDLCHTRLNVVMCRGTIPCDVLCVAEAPGESENVLGLPMIGPAGKLFTQILGNALPEGVTFAIANLVGCIPRDVENGGKLEQPPDHSIRECAPRLQEIVSVCDPKLVVRVGKLAKDWLTPGWKHSIRFHRDIPMVDVVHPAAILRGSVAMRSLSIQRCEVTIANAVEEFVLGVDPFEDVPF